MRNELYSPTLEADIFQQVKERPTFLAAAAFWLFAAAFFCFAAFRLGFGSSAGGGAGMLRLQSQRDRSVHCNLQTQQ